MSTLSASFVHRLGWAALLPVALLVAACGGGATDATQVAARVNKDEVTVHQINFLLQQDRNLRPEQTEAASRRALELLIDRELAVQQAAELRLDREPRTVQALEAARQDVLARAYAERIGGSTPKPSAEEVQRFYDDQPALFKSRRVYSIQEFLIDLPGSRAAEVTARWKAAGTPQAFAEKLRADGIRFGSSAAIRPAEQMPMNMLGELASRNAGDHIVTPAGETVRLVHIVAAQSAPIALEQARPAIEQFIGNQRRSEALSANLKALRAQATVSYKGKFAVGAPAAAASAPPTFAPAGPLVPASGGITAAPALTSAEPVTARPPPPPLPEPGASAPALASDVVKKGLGIK